jgi:MYXO-CTERM domain-containing protein
MSTAPPVNPLAVPTVGAPAEGPTGAGESTEPVVSLPQPHAPQSQPHQDGAEKKPSGAKSGLFGLGFLGLGGSRRRRRGSKRSRRSKKSRKTRGKRKGGCR